MIWEPLSQVVRSQSAVIVDGEGNGNASYLDGDQTDIFKLPKGMEYIPGINSGDGLCQAQDNETAADELLHNYPGTSRTGESHRSGDHYFTDNDSDHTLSNTGKH